MTPQNAEKIINEYGAALAVGTSSGARKKSLLPCSKAKIKLAFYIYIDELIKRGTLDRKLRNDLVMTYSALDSFIKDDEAVEINAIGRKIKTNRANGVDEKSREKYFNFVTNFVTNFKAIEEINDYIHEYQNL